MMAHGGASGEITATPVGFFWGFLSHESFLQLARYEQLVSMRCTAIF